MTDEKNFANELRRWSDLFAGQEYYYGQEPGPVARRAVRYHRPFLPQGGLALDAGCGEGQDLAFLAEQGYAATGYDFTDQGVRKSQKLLAARGLQATVERRNLIEVNEVDKYDLVLSVNALQFMGPHALAALEALQNAVKPGGIIGLSLFARREWESALRDTLFFTSLQELLARFATWQPVEATNLWQWGSQGGTPQEFVTLIARKLPQAANIQIK